MQTVSLSPAQIAVTKGKLKARTWMPYLSHVFGIMRLTVTKDVPTLAVDKYARLYVNEEFITSLTKDEMGYCLLHEVLHVVLSHEKRFRRICPENNKHERTIFNIAADLCIQQLLSRHHRDCEPEGIITIDGDVPGTNLSFKSVCSEGETCESYFYKLRAMYEKGKESMSQGTSNGEFAEWVDGENREGDYNALDPRDSGSNSSGGGDEESGELQSSAVEEAMLDSALRGTEQAMAEHEAKNPGNMPGGLHKTLQSRISKMPDPYDELRNCVSQSVASPVGEDWYTYTRRNRRQRFDAPRKRGVVRYSPECTIVLDTSGSMSGLEERAIAVIAQGIKRVNQPKVCCFDAALQDEKRMSHIEQFEWKGYGGTDMTAAIEHADKGNTDAIVVVTDGETGWPQKKTRARLIIALVQDPGHYCRPPSWARTIECYKEVNTYEH